MLDDIPKPLLLAGVGLVIALPQMAQSNLLATIRQSIDLEASVQKSVHASTADEDAAIAEDRYQNGCVMVVASNSPEHYSALTPGQPVIDGARNVPLAVGTTVCDALGGTGVIVPMTDAEGNEIRGYMQVSRDAQGISWQVVEDPAGSAVPVIGLYAFTGDREVVQQAIAANGTSAQLIQPGL